MKRISIASVIIGLMLASLMPSASASDLEYSAGYSISKSVENCAVVARGTVTGLDGVWRDLKHATPCTTDVTITVTDMIKGKPNAGANKVKFMVEGGICIDPEGEWTQLSVSYEPQYKIGEDVIVFLAECDDDFCNDFPYGKLGHWRGKYGKRLIREETQALGWLYLVSKTDPAAVKEIGLPLALSIDMMKATLKDKDAVVTLEKEIKEEIKNSKNVAANISQTLMNKLKRDVKAALEKKVEPEGKDKTEAKPAESK